MVIFTDSRMYMLHVSISYPPEKLQHAYLTFILTLRKQYAHSFLHAWERTPSACHHVVMIESSPHVSFFLHTKSKIPCWKEVTQFLCRIRISKMECFITMIVSIYSKALDIRMNTMNTMFILSETLETESSTIIIYSKLLIEGSYCHHYSSCF